ncbi:MAG TPA: exodeoxyribonuclease VII large subunit [bacterium]|nr:exodeoxyribonuclease VII large subunit [bacterium]HPP29343.1 exodeoxyribonuclease VII large subunit [bacterium]
MEIVSLREFLGQVRQVLEFAYPLQYRITAEIARLNIHHQSGHCFPDLVEKEKDKVVAKASGVIWKSNLDGILKKFRDTVGEELKEGMKVLLVIEVRFHELYGLRLNILDIDPSYTLGEFALSRKRILAQLDKEGLLNRNKQLPFPPVPQRIAVISSESSAGYEDFLNTLYNNPYGYRFSITLFPAYMQGEQAEPSILAALERCYKRRKQYDVLVIIRGGGDNIDLHCFDSYNIGKAIASFPLPVLSGIGHTRDETVVDIVAHKKLISPTATGEFVINRMRNFEETLEGISSRLVDFSRGILTEQQALIKEADNHLNIFAEFFLRKVNQNFNSIVSDFRTNVSKCIASREFFLKQMPDNLASALRIYVKGHINFLERQEDRVSLMNPVNVLKRGYSITFKDGKIVKNADSLQEEDRIETQLFSGRIKSKVEEIKKRSSSGFLKGEGDDRE